MTAAGRFCLLDRLPDREGGERIGERSTLYRTDAEHAGAPVLAGGDDFAGAARPGELFELAR